MALVNPCDTSLDPVNTGIECQSAMGVTAQFFWLPEDDRFTQADIDASPYDGSFTLYAEARCHDIPSKRWYKMFGFSAPITSITENNESDVIETFDNGASGFVRYGMYNRTIFTDKGGLCFADHLMRFPGGYSFIECDKQNQVLMYEASEGVYGGIPTNMIKGLGPVLTTFSTTYKNRFMVSFDPVAYVQNSKLFKGTSTENILGVKSLIDTEVVAGTQTQTTTNIFVGVNTICADTDLVELYATELPVASNFIVTNVATGAVITPSAVVVQTGEIKITGTYVSGQSYYVALAAASVLYAADITPYDGVKKATVTIP